MTIAALRPESIVKNNPAPRSTAPKTTAAVALIRPEMLAVGYAALGDMDEAFAHLDEALEARSAGLIYLAVDPMYDPLKADPRFDELVKKVGLTN